MEAGQLTFTLGCDVDAAHRKRATESGFTARFDQDKYQVSAARWLLRGLSVENAIRKVEVDREIGHNHHNF